MNTLVALILTLSVMSEDGTINTYQDIPATFYSMEDCQEYKTDNALPDVFQCAEMEE